MNYSNYNAISNAINSSKILFKRTSKKNQLDPKKLFNVDYVLYLASKWSNATTGVSEFYSGPNWMLKKDIAIKYKTSSTNKLSNDVVNKFSLDRFYKNLFKLSRNRKFNSKICRPIFRLPKVFLFKPINKMKLFNKNKIGDKFKKNFDTKIFFFTKSNKKTIIKVKLDLKKKKTFTFLLPYYLLNFYLNPNFKTSSNRNIKLLWKNLISDFNSSKIEFKEAPNLLIKKLNYSLLVKKLNLIFKKNKLGFNNQANNFVCIKNGTETPKIFSQRFSFPEYFNFYKENRFSGLLRSFEWQHLWYWYLKFDKVRGRNTKTFRLLPYLWLNFSMFRRNWNKSHWDRIGQRKTHSLTKTKRLGFFFKFSSTLILKNKDTKSPVPLRASKRFLMGNLKYNRITKFNKIFKHSWQLTKHKITKIIKKNIHRKNKLIGRDFIFQKHFKNKINNLSFKYNWAPNSITISALIAQKLIFVINPIKHHINPINVSTKNVNLFPLINENKEVAFPYSFRKIISEPNFYEIFGIAESFKNFNRIFYKQTSSKFRNQILFENSLEYNLKSKVTIQLPLKQRQYKNKNLTKFIKSIIK